MGAAAAAGRRSGRGRPELVTGPPSSAREPAGWGGGWAWMRDQSGLGERITRGRPEKRGRGLRGRAPIATLPRWHRTWRRDHQERHKHECVHPLHVGRPVEGRGGGGRRQWANFAAASTVPEMQSKAVYIVVDTLVGSGGTRVWIQPRVGGWFVSSGSHGPDRVLVPRNERTKLQSHLFRGLSLEGAAGRRDGVGGRQSRPPGGSREM
jgi:hypothetical protein